MSAILYDTGKSARVPVIAFHCTQWDIDGTSISSKEMLKNLALTLSYQILELLEKLPGTRQMTDCLSVAELANRSTFSTPTTAIKLLEKVLDKLPCECICLVDGFQNLESNGDQIQEDLKQFLAAFGCQNEAAVPKLSTGHKLLVTTPGWTEMLVDLCENGQITQQPCEEHILRTGVHVLSMELKAILNANAKFNIPS